MNGDITPEGALTQKGIGSFGDGFLENPPNFCLFLKIAIVVLGILMPSS